MNNLANWLRSFDANNEGSTHDIDSAIVLAAFTQRLIKTVPGTNGGVKLTTKGIRAKSHDKRYTLSMDEVALLREGLDAVFAPKGSPLHERVILLRGKLQ
jgi:hypothetical protein